MDGSGRPSVAVARIGASLIATLRIVAFCIGDYDQSERRIGITEVVAALAARGIGFKSLTQQIDTTTSGGKLIFHVFGALAEFERDLIRERTHAGLAAARARGRLEGRPRKLADAKQLELARTLYASGEIDIDTICATLGISRATLYRYLKEHTVDPAASS